MAINGYNDRHFNTNISQLLSKIRTVYPKFCPLNIKQHTLSNKNLDIVHSTFIEEG
jgi:hypothetical protein